MLRWFFWFNNGIGGSGIMIKVIKKENKEGMINIIANDLYKFEDIQEACIKLGYDNHKMLDELTGFPTGNDKCVGVLVEN